MVAHLWVDAHLAPSETLDCPPQVLAAAVAVLYRRRQEAAEAKTRPDRQASWDRMHQILGTGA